MRVKFRPALVGVMKCTCIIQGIGITVSLYYNGPISVRPDLREAVDNSKLLP
jgi:hypothetical protein